MSNAYNYKSDAWSFAKVPFLWRSLLKLKSDTVPPDYGSVVPYLLMSYTQLQSAPYLGVGNRANVFLAPPVFVKMTGSPDVVFNKTWLAHSVKENKIRGVAIPVGEYKAVCIPIVFYVNERESHMGLIWSDNGVDTARIFLPMKEAPVAMQRLMGIVVPFLTTETQLLTGNKNLRPAANADAFRGKIGSDWWNLWFLLFAMSGKLTLGSAILTAETMRKQVKVLATITSDIAKMTQACLVNRMGGENADAVRYFTPGDTKIVISLEVFTSMHKMLLTCATPRDAPEWGRLKELVVTSGGTERQVGRQTAERGAKAGEFIAVTKTPVTKGNSALDKFKRDAKSMTPEVRAKWERFVPVERARKPGEVDGQKLVPVFWR